MSEKLDYVVTFLEMIAPPADAPSEAPPRPEALMMRAEAPPVHYFLYLYRAVGARWQWSDKLRDSPEKLRAFVGNPHLETWILYWRGSPAGFFMLDFAAPGVCEISYFGLMEEALGLGLGGWLLRTAIAKAWARPGVAKLVVDTCTLDHPAALPLYRKAGFAPVREEERSRAWEDPARFGF